jgi:cytochrome c oxidase assembly protein subunit 15
MKGIRIWLWSGVIMVLVQVMLGGVTRLTNSGLSITEWDLIMGAIPPTNDEEWNQAFEQYKQFPEYRLEHAEMDLAGFKKIFFWEYLHRNWARLIGFVFIVPFLVFLFQKRLDRIWIRRLLFVFVLGGLQGLMGWIMVASGLIDKPWVSPYNLTLHLILALAIYLYLLWLIFISYNKEITEDHPTVNKSIRWILGLLVVQIIFGGFMAGTKAGMVYTTWPLMGNDFFPEGMTAYKGIPANIFENQVTINFIHRTLAIIIACFILSFWFVNRKYSSSVVHKLDDYMAIGVIIQFTLGVFTLLNASAGIPIALGVAHQLGAFVLTGVALAILFYSKRRNTMYHKR